MVSGNRVETNMVGEEGAVRHTEGLYGYGYVGWLEERARLSQSLKKRRKRPSCNTGQLSEP